MTAPTPTTWASITDVYNYTGVDVSQAQVNQAQGVIDAYSQRTYLSFPNLLGRDINHLVKAVAYQAAWMSTQTDYFSRSAVTGVSQDGVSATYADKAAIALSPLAAREIKNLSWMRTRAVQMQSDFINGVTSPLGGPVYDDPSDVWTPVIV